MKVELHLKDNNCQVTKEAGDPRFTRGYAPPESTFLYRVQKELKKQGYDVIKKRMWKDGSLVDDTQQYVRTRIFTKDSDGWAVYNAQYATYDLGELFNELKTGESMWIAVLQ